MANLESVFRSSLLNRVRFHSPAHLSPQTRPAPLLTRAAAAAAEKHCQDNGLGPQRDTQLHRRHDCNAGDFSEEKKTSGRRLAGKQIAACLPRGSRLIGEVIGKLRVRRLGAEAAGRHGPHGVKRQHVNTRCVKVTRTCVYLGSVSGWDATCPGCSHHVGFCCRTDGRSAGRTWIPVNASQSQPFGHAAHNSELRYTDVC